MQVITCLPFCEDVSRVNSKFYISTSLVAAFVQPHTMFTMCVSFLIFMYTMYMVTIQSVKIIYIICFNQNMFAKNVMYLFARLDCQVRFKYNLIKIKISIMNNILSVGGMFMELRKCLNVTTMISSVCFELRFFMRAEIITKCQYIINIVFTY